MAGRVILGIPNVEPIERAVGLRRECARFRHAQVPNAGAIGHLAGIGLRTLEQADPAAPVRAMLEPLACESPADGAVAQRHHLVGDAGIDQRLGADDRPGAAGAIDDDGGLGIRRGPPGAKHQFRAGHADRAGDVHGCIFVEPPHIQDGDVGFAGDQRGDFVGAERGRMPPRLHQFAKGLGIGIDVLEQFVAGGLPAPQPAVELADVAVAQGFQAIHR